MHRRSFLAAAGAAALPASGQQPYPGVAYRDYSRVLPDLLRRLAREAYQRRSTELRKLTTRAAVEARKSWARETFWQLIGGKLQRTPLNVRRTGEFERKGYKVENLVYESRPNFHIPANLYIPTLHKPPFPGVLFQMGHSVNGKAAASYQRCCQALAQLGYLVLAFDPMGQGERIYYPDMTLRQSRLGSADDEHTLPGKQMLLKGDTSTRLQTWDAVRSLDLLAEHPLVDAKRLASTGQSGGGTLTMFLMAVDDRLTTAVVASGQTENFACADFNPPGSTDDGEQNFPGSAPLAWDRWDVFYPFAPKPLLVSVSDKDYFGTYSPRYVANGWEEFQKLKRVYEVLGKPEHIAWGGTALPHGLSYDTRLLIYNWFNRWMQSASKDIVEEPPTKPERDEVLWATKAGNVVRSLDSETPFTLMKQMEVRASGESLEPLLRLDRGGYRHTVLKRMPAYRAEIRALDIESAPEVFVPAWLYTPARGEPRQCFVLLQSSGRLTNWREDELFHELAQRGYAVCVPDLRGVGDATPEFGRGAARHARDHANEEAYAWASLVLGKPLLGQRVTDVLAAVQTVRTIVKPREIILAAQARFTVPAQIAASLDKDIVRLYLAGGLVSFRSVVETEDFNSAFANFVPRMLQRTDLPQITASLAPRPVYLGGAVDARGDVMPTMDVERLYRQSKHVRVLSDARWDTRRFEEVAGASV